MGGPVTATDPDDDALTYSLSGGADMGSFKIDSGSGQIMVGKGTKLDYEGGEEDLHGRGDGNRFRSAAVTRRW